MKIRERNTCVIKSFSDPLTSQSSSSIKLQIHHPGLHKLWNWRNVVQSNKKQKISDNYNLRGWWKLRGKIFETGADISTRKDFIFFLDVEGFLYYLWHLSAGHVKQLNDMVATKYSLPVAPIHCIVFQDVAEKAWEIFCDTNLEVDGIKECLSHKATARRVEGVGGWASYTSFLSREVQRAPKWTLQVKLILSAQRILNYLAKSI
jgi:hypothetical protein